MSTKPPFKGHDSYAGGTESTSDGKTWGSRPVVGQSSPYKSGDNAHGRHQNERGGNAKAHHDGGSSITQESMLPDKDL